MQTAVAIPPEPAHLGGTRATFFQSFLIAFVLWSWWDALARAGGAGATAPAADLRVAAAVMVTARVAGSAVEASFYTLWWRARGAHLPFLRFFAVLVLLSFVDCVALLLAQLAGRAPGLAPWLAPLTGPGVLHARLPGLEPGLLAAFGGLGLLTLARITMTARFQAAALARPLAGPLLLTAAAWLATRVVAWWTLDLFRGMSPIR